MKFGEALERPAGVSLLMFGTLLSAQAFDRFTWLGDCAQSINVINCALKLSIIDFSFPLLAIGSMALKYGLRMVGLEEQSRGLGYITSAVAMLGILNSAIYAGYRLGGFGSESGILNTDFAINLITPIAIMIAMKVLDRVKK